MKLYQHEGWWWLGCVVRGRLYLVTRKSRLGDCVHP